ncbi:MAG: hypothetical protein FWD88_05585 [Treponema sp.]|nr:hypothetical protein [Treponema sp.]
MTEKLKLFRKELCEAVERLPSDRELSPGDIRVLADVASVYTALCGLAEHAPEAPADDIADELAGAEAKYAEYRRSGDHAMLEMARDELRHAAIYIDRAGVSNDNELRERLPGYRARLAEMERMIKGPQGKETHPIL